MDEIITKNNLLGKHFYDFFYGISAKIYLASSAANHQLCHQQTHTDQKKESPRKRSISKGSKRGGQESDLQPLIWDKCSKTDNASPKKWRKRWDSNPRALADNLISSQARYDHFDTLPNQGSICDKAPKNDSIINRLLQDVLANFMQKT